MERDEDAEDQALPWDHPDVLGPRGLSPDAQRLGLDRNTEEGALVAFAGSLNRANRKHRFVAWVLLVAFATPAALAILHLLGELIGAVWRAGGA